MTEAGRAAPSGVTEPERTIRLDDPDATAALGASIAGQLSKGDMVALFGDLGAGKTTLARGVLRALGHDGAVPSPTFTLVQHYELAALTVAHFDLYRLGDVDELRELGLDEALHTGAVLVEWPEIAAGALPADRMEVHFADAGSGRTVRLVGLGNWAGRLARLRA